VGFKRQWLENVNGWQIGVLGGFLLAAALAAPSRLQEHTYLLFLLIRQCNAAYPQLIIIVLCVTLLSFYVLFLVF